MTISLVAVFIRCCSGRIVGRLLHSLGGIVVAILISGFVSLSLTELGKPLFEIGARHAARPLYRALWKAVSTCCCAGTNGRSKIALRFSLATLAVAILMLVGTVYLFFKHAHRLHSQPGQRFMFGVNPGSAGHLVRIHGEAPPRRRRRGAGRTRSSGRGGLRGWRNQAFCSA